MRIPDQTIEEIIQHLDIVSFMNTYVTLKNKGGRWWGLCPFHSEKTPSFSVTPDKGLYYCFGCHKGGTIFSFVMEVENLSFVEAAELLAGKAGVQLDLAEGYNRDHDRDKILHDLYERIAKSLHYILKEGKGAESARHYLLERGVDAERIEQFLLGFMPEEKTWLKRFLKRKSYSDEILAETGLFSRKNVDISFFSGRIMFPITTAHNRIVGFGGRILTNREPKYLNSPESSLFKKGRMLYGLNHALKDMRKENSVILVEGYFDVIAMHQHGFTTAIAPLGTALTDEQAHMIRRYVTDVYLLFDGDQAGRKAVHRAIHICEKQDVNTSVVELPQGTDPADYLQKYGREALKKLLKYSITNFEYLVSEAQSRHDLSNVDGKQRFFHSLLPYINILHTEIKRESCIKRIAELLDVDYQTVQRDIKRVIREKEVNTFREGSDEQRIISVELYLLLAITVNREYFEEVRKFLSIEDFEDVSARGLFIALEEAYRNEESSMDALLGRIDDLQLRDLIIEKTATEEFKENYEKVIEDSIQTIRRKSVEKKRRNIEHLLRKYKSEGIQSRELKDLLNEKIYYDRELEKLRVTWNG